MKNFQYELSSIVDKLYNIKNLSSLDVISKAYSITSKNIPKSLKTKTTDNPSFLIQYIPISPNVAMVAFKNEILKLQYGLGNLNPRGIKFAKYAKLFDTHLTRAGISESQYDSSIIKLVLELLNIDKILLDEITMDSKVLMLNTTFDTGRLVRNESISIDHATYTEYFNFLNNDFERIYFKFLDVHDFYKSKMSIIFKLINDSMDEIRKEKQYRDRFSVTDEEYGESYSDLKDDERKTFEEKNSYIKLAKFIDRYLLNLYRIFIYYSNYCKYIVLKY